MPSVALGALLTTNLVVLIEVEFIWKIGKMGRIGRIVRMV